MASGKQFKRKMKNTKSGHSYWRIHGVPVPRYDNPVEYCKRVYSDWVIINGFIFYAEHCTALGKRTHTLSLGRTRSIKNGTMLRYHRSKTSAVAFLNELQKGFHSDAVADIVEYHRALDEFDQMLDETSDDYAY